MTTDTNAALRPDAGSPSEGPLGVTGLAVLLVVAGAVGLTAAFVLAVEKFRLLSDPFYTPSCSVNATLSCAPVMSSKAAEVFGFPNPLLGIAGFAVVATTGAALLAGGRLAGWYWAGLQAGVTAAVVFVHWLIYQSVFVIGALCPYCMVVWTVTIPTFAYVTLHNLAPRQPRMSRRGRAVAGFVLRQHSNLLAIWLLALTATVVASMWLG